MTKKVLMIIPRWKYDWESTIYDQKKDPDYSYAFHLAIPYLSAALKKAGIPFKVLNMNHVFSTEHDMIKNELDSGDYSIVATGASSSYYNQVERIVNYSITHPSKPVTVIGGQLVTTEPDLIMKAIHPDFAMMGDCDITFPELCKTILSPDRETQEKIPGLLFWNQNGQISKNEVSPSQIPHIDELPFPDLDSCDFRTYLDNFPNNSVFNFLTAGIDFPRIYSIMGSRGCPFNCSFCCHTTKFQTRALNGIFDELYLNVEKYNINIVYFIDDCFVLNRNRALEFCSRFIKLQKDLNREMKWIAQGVVNAIDEELMVRFKESGCICLSYGFESMSPIVLKSMHKPITPEKIDYAYHLTRKYGIKVQANFILGDTKETIETYRGTLKYWKENCSSQVSLSTIYPYPNSEIYQLCLKRGLIPDKLFFLKYRRGLAILNFTEALSDKEYMTMVNEIDYHMENYREKVEFEKLEFSKIKSGRYQTEVDCPFCRKRLLIDNIQMPENLNYFSDFRRELMIATCRHCTNSFRVMFKREYIRGMFALARKKILKYMPAFIKSPLRIFYFTIVNWIHHENPAYK